MKALELYFLTRHYKQIILPDIHYTEMSDAVGCYLYPNVLHIIEGQEYFSKKGIILIDPQNPEEHASTIAHEWRHHWQFHNGLLSCSKKRNSGEFWHTTDTMEEADAFIFSHHYAPDDGTRALWDYVQRRLAFYQKPLIPSENALHYRKNVPLLLASFGY